MQVRTHQRVLDKDTNLYRSCSVIGLQLSGSLDQFGDEFIPVMYMDSLPQPSYLSTIIKWFKTTSGQSAPHYFQFLKYSVQSKLRPLLDTLHLFKTLLIT